MKSSAADPLRQAIRKVQRHRKPLRTYRPQQVRLSRGRSRHSAGPTSKKTSYI